MLINNKINTTVRSLSIFVAFALLPFYCAVPDHERSSAAHGLQFSPQTCLCAGQ